MALEIKTIKSVPAVIEFNFDEFLKEVTTFSEKYKDLVVTEENLGEMIKVKNKLSGAEKFIEDYRKTEKKKMEQPIKAFETQCKTLLKVIQEVNEPIRLQLNSFEEERKKAKEQEVQTAINNLVKKLGLKPKYAEQLTIDKKYLNKTQNDIDTIKDLETRGQLLLNSQAQEEQLEQLKKEKLDLIQVTIEGTNKKYDTNLKISEFEFLQNKEMSDIPKTIEARANYIYQERLAKENAMKTMTSSAVIEEQKEKSKPRAESETSQEELYTFTLALKDATLEQSKQLKKFLDINNFNYNLVTK